MKNLRTCETFELEKLAEQKYKELEAIQAELKLQAEFTITDALDVIKNITDNYNMGMLTQKETLIQIAGVTASKMKEHKNLGR